MNLDECRDRIAVLLGWKRQRLAECTIWYQDGKAIGIHPVHDTIDGLEMLWPQGWCFEVCRNEFGVAAQARRNGEPWCVGITEGRNCHTEYEARLRLLLAVLEKEKADA